MSDGIIKYGARLAYKQHARELKSQGFTIHFPLWNELEDWIKRAWIKAIAKLCNA